MAASFIKRTVQIAIKTSQISGGFTWYTTSEIRARSQACPCRICGGQVDNKKGGFPNLTVFLSQYIYIYIYIKPNMYLIYKYNLFLFCFFLSCKANARVNPAKTGYGPHSSWFLCCSMYFMLFYVLFVLCRSVYCLCVYVYWTTVTGWLPNCS